MVDDVVLKDRSQSEGILLDRGFCKVYDNHEGLAYDEIYDTNISLWVHQDKGYILELEGSSNGEIIHSANLHYELETLKCFEYDKDVCKWISELFDYDKSRILPARNYSHMIRHVRKDVKSGLGVYLSKIDDLNIFGLPKYVSDMGDLDSLLDGVGMYFMKINSTWVHFDKHPLFQILNEDT